MDGNIHESLTGEGGSGAAYVCPLNERRERMLSDYTSRNLDRIEQVSRQGKKVQGLFRLMTNSSDLWLEAYAKIYANKGAITKGIDNNTLDGMSEDRITNLINLLKENRYLPAPARRTHIPKSNGKTRPLGIPRGDEKLVQEVARRLLETIYEPRFENTSHGFRPNKSCHTALTKISKAWGGTTWFIDMDIQGYFDNISHRKLVELLKQTIDDTKFISIIKRMLKAGYLEEWAYHRTYSGTPQGDIVSPVLANIYLHELDVFMKVYTTKFEGGKREVNPEWKSLEGKIYRLRRKIDEIGKDNPKEIKKLRQDIDELDKLRKTLHYTTPDSIFRRLKYARYADDFLIGVIGSRTDAREVATKVRRFLKKELLLEIAEEKSGISHSSKGVQFLGYGIRTRSTERERVSVCHINKVTGQKRYGKKRTMTNVIYLEVPREKVHKFCLERGYMRSGKPIHRAELLQNSDHEIISQYNSEFRGIANFYGLVNKTEIRKIEYYALSSLFKTLAAKHKASAKQMRGALKHGSEHQLFYRHNGQRKTLRVFKLKHRKSASVQNVDELPIPMYGGSTELLERMNAGKCEYCGKEKGYFEIHHVRKLKDIIDGKEPWQISMIQRRRKTLVLCVECHDLLHAGKLPGWRLNIHK